jgi:hypothetical protein
LVTEAGGRVETYAPEGSDTILVTKRLLATNGLIADAMRSILQRK